MATEIMEAAASSTDFDPKDAGHSPYLFTGDQAQAMVTAGIIPQDKSTELLDGVLYQVTKTETHNYIVGELSDRLRTLCPADYHLREEKSNRAGERSLPEPDIALCKGTRNTYWPNLPTLDRLALVVEVSQHSETADHVTKFALYADARIPCYWIVEVRSRSVAVWTNPAEKTYQTVIIYKAGESIPVVIDGVVRGEIALDDFFPPES